VHVPTSHAPSPSLGRGVQYAIAVGITALIYDLILTMETEIRLIWRSSRSLTKYLYLFNRYSVLVAVMVYAYFSAGFSAPMTDEFCYTYTFWTVSFEAAEGAGLITVLALLRVYALYRSTKGIKVVLVLLCTLDVVPAFTLSVLPMITYYKEQGTITYNSVLGICALSGKPSYTWIIWMCMVIYDSIVCAMIIYKTYQHTRGSVHTPILSLLLRDGLLFYAIMLVSEILNLVAFTVFSSSLYLLGMYPQWCFASLLISRLYLNMRDVDNHHEWTIATALRHDSELDADVEGAKVRQARRRREAIHLQELSNPSHEAELGSLEGAT